MKSSTMRSQSSSTAGQAGFTLTEFLVILALVVLLLIIFAQQLQTSYIPRARDAQRKTDLEKIKIAFEDYYNDHGCYPEPEILEECYSGALAPYLPQIPCDPITKQPYLYEPDPDNQCHGYRLLSQLQYESDPEIIPMACYSPFNYGISVGMSLVPEDCNLASPTPTPTPSPSPSGSAAPGSPSPTPTPDIVAGEYACDPDGECNVYADPWSAGCPATYPTAAMCDAACDNPANRCLQ